MVANRAITSRPGERGGAPGKGDRLVAAEAGAGHEIEGGADGIDEATNGRDWHRCRVAGEGVDSRSVPRFSMFRDMRNSPLLGTNGRLLTPPRDRLPPGWRAKPGRLPSAGRGRGIDGVLAIVAPDRRVPRPGGARRAQRQRENREGAPAGARSPLEPGLRPAEVQRSLQLPGPPGHLYGPGQPS